MVKDGRNFKAKNRKSGHDVRNLKAALSSMPKPVHPKKGNQGLLKNATANGADAETSDAPPVEIQFAQKLASNDPVMRNRAVKKLKRWLEARSAADGDDSLCFNEIEMMRLWKGLHYCFWMSDKPLVQEELAEIIGSMINSFGNNESAALLYASSFVTTLGREWVGIDRWRMDKFMMLVRRVLRHCFCFLAKFGWKEDLVTKWSEICEKQVVSANSLNESMKKKKKKRRGNKQQTEASENGIESNTNQQAPVDHSPAPSQRVGHRAALGFQLHFVDIYLEELAKIGGEDLPAETIQLLLTPFIAELARGDDERLSQHIEERIFHHLMRQSDVGIAYEEGDSGDEDDDEEMDEGEDEEIGDEEGDDVAGGEDDEDEEDMELDESIKDPRAGKVDVILPQLQPDYEKLAEALFQAGSAKEVSKPKRDRLYRLTKQLKALATGVFPLAIELSDDEEEVPKKISVAKAAKKAAEEEFQRMVKLREERKKFKQAIKEQKKAGADAPTEEQEVKMINDDDEEEEEEEIEEEEEKEEEKTPTKQKKSKIPRDARGRKKGSAKKIQQNSLNGHPSEAKADSPQKKEESPVSQQPMESEPTTPDSSKKKNKLEKKKKKLEKLAQKDGLSPSTKTKESKKGEKVEATESFETPEKKKKKKKKSKDQSPNAPSSPLILSLTPEQKNQLKKHKEMKSEDSFSTSTPTEKAVSTKKITNNKESDKVDSSLILNLSTEKQGKKKKKATAANEDEQVITLSSKKRKHSDDGNAEKIFKKKAFTPMQKLVSSELLTNSLPTKGGMKKKRINFSLMENKCSSLTDIDKSILDSPDIPFHADKKPKQGVLKKTGQVSSVDTTPVGGKADKQSVAYNTLLNGRSTFMKRRAFASDFF